MKNNLIEISFLPKVSFTRGHLDFEYGWAKFNQDKKLVFCSKEKAEEEIIVSEKDITMMDNSPFFTKYINRSKDKQAPVKYPINQDIQFFIVPGDNYVLNKIPVNKKDVIVFTTPAKIFKNKKRFNACCHITEKPDFDVVRKVVDGKVILTDLEDKQYWNPEEQRQKELSMADYKGVNTLIDKNTSEIWGYMLEDIKSGEQVQKSIKEVKALANEHKISNMKLVDRNGTIFLQGIGCEISNFPQKYKE